MGGVEGFDFGKMELKCEMIELSELFLASDFLDFWIEDLEPGLELEALKSRSTHGFVLSGTGGGTGGLEDLAGSDFGEKGFSSNGLGMIPLRDLRNAVLKFRWIRTQRPWFFIFMPAEIRLGFNSFSRRSLFEPLHAGKPRLPRSVLSAGTSPWKRARRKAFQTRRTPANTGRGRSGGHRPR